MVVITKYMTDNKNNVIGENTVQQKPDF